MTELCWEEKNNGKYCKNYRLDNKTKCRHHNVDSYLQTYLIVSFLFVTLSTASYYYYSQNESDINLYIYMTINNICKNINELGYNICISLEAYLENYRKKMLVKQGLFEYDLENLKMYTLNTLNYLKDYFKMYDSFLFNYTMKNIHDFILKNILNRN
jgi:cytochrome c oxidase subunit IV